MIHSADSETFLEFLENSQPEHFTRIREIANVAILLAVPSLTKGIPFIMFSLNRVDHNSRLMLVITVNGYTEVEILFTRGGNVRTHIREMDFCTIGYITELLEQLQTQNLLKRT